MKIGRYDYNTVSSSEQRRKRLMTIGIAIVINWLLWFILSIPSYRLLSSSSLRQEIIEDLWQTALETVILVELAFGYSRIIIKVLWKTPHNFSMLVLQSLVLLAMNFSASALMGWAYTLFYPDMIDSGIYYRIMFSDGVTVYFVTSVYFMSYLFARYREETEKVFRAENEQLHQHAVALQAKMDKLALQTNNHFVFNSLSTLESLILVNSEKALSFLEGFSNIYRFLVTNADRHFVSLEEELSFTKEYIRLIRYRYDSIDIRMDETLDDAGGLILPVSVQQLVENAIKHNRHGKDSGLSIRIEYDDNCIRVSNNILPRNDYYDHGGTGLDSLQARYTLLSNKRIEIQNDGNVFSAVVPILFMEDIKDENIDS